MSGTTTLPAPAGLAAEIKDFSADERGSALVEYIIAAALIALSVGLFSVWMGRQAQDQAAVVAGRQMAEQAASLARWAAVHQPLIRSAMPPGTGTTTAITSSTYDGYLPASRTGRNRWGQTLSLTLYRTAGDAIEGALCSAGGGRRIPEDVLHQVALGAGGPGGFVSTLDLSRVQGVSGGWGGPAALTALNAAGAGLSGGNACVSLNLSGLNQVTAALQRFACPDGTLECNTMRTDQYQGGNSLLQARDVQSVGGRIYSESADGTRKAEINAQGQVDAAGGALTQRDAVGDNPTFQVFGDVAALYDTNGQWRWRNDSSGTYTTNQVAVVADQPVAPAPVVVAGGIAWYPVATVGKTQTGAGQISVATTPDPDPTIAGGIVINGTGGQPRVVASVSSQAGGTGYEGGTLVAADLGATTSIATGAIVPGGRFLSDGHVLMTGQRMQDWYQLFDPAPQNVPRFLRAGSLVTQRVGVVHDGEFYGRVAAYMQGGHEPVIGQVGGTELRGTAGIYVHGADLYVSRQTIGRPVGQEGGKLRVTGGGDIAVTSYFDNVISTMTEGHSTDPYGLYFGLTGMWAGDPAQTIQVRSPLETRAPIYARDLIQSDTTISAQTGNFSTLNTGSLTVNGTANLNGAVNLGGPCGGCLRGERGEKGDKGDKGDPGETIYVPVPSPGG